MKDNEDIYMAVAIVCAWWR